MLRPDIGPSWHLEYKFHSFVDFCIWVLERDGLQVAPFDRHHGGDTMLQRVGLTADDWLAWMHDVVTFYQQAMQALHQLSWQAMTRWKQSLEEQGGFHWHAQAEPLPSEWTASLAQSLRSASGPSVYDQRLLMTRLFENPPPALWHGNADVSHRLYDLWEHYGSRGKQWTDHLLMQWMVDGTEEQLQKDLLPYHARLEMLNICFAKYSQEVDYLIPPVSVIMTLADGQLDGDTFRLRVLRAAEELAMGTAS
ncbi:MAG: hypothetical protein H0V70_25675 [Ktedonobacteraceae bacterium]|nr:hypothetical protein [Ktedonobacteraceae bacterium]